MAARARDSAGRLLRVLQDCELFHMEAAIASLDSAKTGIRSDSLLKPSGGGDVDVLERTAEGRVLSLSDHKRIARLQAALTAVAKAYDAGAVVERAEAKDPNRNLICAVAGAAMMQATRDCTSSRTNCCIWAPQAEKLHVLLEWMMKREAKACDYVRQLLLQWIELSAEKQKQLAASLSLFELLQRRRRNLMNNIGEKGSLSMMADRVGAYMDALRAIVKRGITQVADSRRVKPSKLGLIALETLGMLCGDVASQYTTLDKPGKQTFISHGLACKMVESMHFFLVILRQWHMHSPRRQFLSYALEHLHAYVKACDNLFRIVDADGCRLGKDSDSNILEALDVLCWHWETTVPMVCTRSDVSSRIQKNQPGEVLVRVLRKWSVDVLNTKGKLGGRRVVLSPEVAYAQLRYVCILMDFAGGIKGCSKAFEGFSAVTKTYFVGFFIRVLSIARKNRDDIAVVTILKVLRAVLLHDDAFNLLSSRDEEQTFLSQLLRLHSNALPVYNNSERWASNQAELEFFISEFVIARELFITELVARIKDSNSQANQNAIFLGRVLLYQLDSAKTQKPLYGQWRQQLTPVILRLLFQDNQRIRRLALSCLPSLDRLSCMASLCKAEMDNSNTRTVTSIIGYLLATSSQSTVEVMATWFIDVYQFGISQAHSKPMKSPSEMNKCIDQIRASAAENDALKEQQDKLVVLCFGPNGWSKNISSVKVRSQVLCVLLRKIFGSPRDPLLLRILREFVACGWVDHDVFKLIAKQLITHMMNLQRLTEKLLGNNSSFAAKIVEGLLFSRLAPLLVLRMLPREIFEVNSAQTLLCGCEDLDHLNDYIALQQELHLDNSETTLGISEDDTENTSKNLFHALACSIVDPLEFKEVKMLATEALAKFPLPIVLPFVFAYLICFVREMNPHGERSTSSIVNDENIPDSCGLVTAKLMVYYLNRVFSEDDRAYKDGDISSRALVVLIQILGIQSGEDSTDASLLTDLQRGCIDCIAILLLKLAAEDIAQDRSKSWTTSTSSLVNLLLSWIFGTESDEKLRKLHYPEELYFRVQTLLESEWSEAQYRELPLQVRICCCNILVSAISRSENDILASWKTQGLIPRVALATERCNEDEVVAGGLQVIFSFLYKAGTLLSMEDNSDLQLVRVCFKTTVTQLETTRSEPVAMNGLKVIGALIGKMPMFVGTLPPTDLQRLMERCLISLRDRRISAVVSELAQSLLQAMTPP